MAEIKQQRMHAAEREEAILEILKQRGFVRFSGLGKRIDASPATIRRDLERMHSEGLLTRVRGGAKLLAQNTTSSSLQSELSGVPFHENVHKNQKQKKAIGCAAAALCSPESAIMMDGGSTTLQICKHLDGLNLQVLTNSLHIVSALLPQQGSSGNVVCDLTKIHTVVMDNGIDKKTVNMLEKADTNVIVVEV